MGIVKVILGEARELRNYLKIIFKNGKIDRVLLDCKVFPLFCNHCNRSQTNLFYHLGSRYGQVGDIPCEFCGHSIAVVDHDNIVDEIQVNGECCSFRELYLLDADYISWFEDWYKKDLGDFVPMDSLTGWMSVNQLREQLEKLTGIESDDRAIYQTDKRFKPLPPDINRWINLLDKSTVPLPSYVSKIGE